jgi:uncharacterized repeat protein (TIGR03803 family)
VQTKSGRDFPTLAVCAMLLALHGCGGGGGSSAPSPSPPPPPPVNTNFKVGGTVSGLGVSENVTVLNNGGDVLLLNGNGGFTFSTSQATASSYAVTVKTHSPGVACSVGNGSGSVGTSDVTAVTVSCAAGKMTILHSFGASTADGRNPQAGLIMDSAGNLYGTTYGGGTIGAGALFKISPDGTETILHSFSGGQVDSVNPTGPLTIDGAGNLYGTTNGGGPTDLGTAFKLGADGTHTVLHWFEGGPNDGAYPSSGLTMDSAGNLFGTTFGGGAGGEGTLFKISAIGTESLVHSFVGTQIDGRHPRGGLTMDGAGNLYGTTIDGGVGIYDFGTVYKISPDGTESVVYTFLGEDGGEPYARVTIDGSGNLFGTTLNAGNATVFSSGVVFKITPNGTNTVLHYFTGGITPAITDAGYPYAGLLIGSDGFLYGTSSQGGVNGFGTVFKAGIAGTLNIVHAFAGAPADGAAPYGDLIVDSAGNLYGTTALGGANNAGTVFMID